MARFSEIAIDAFLSAIEDFESTGRNIDSPIFNHFTEDNLKGLLYHKCWIDDVQWTLEDIIRDPDIDPVKALEIKRRIDRSNQNRTDMVECIDSYFLDLYKDVTPKDNAKINTESPAWAIDRLSILMLKIHYMSISVKDSKDPQLKRKCEDKLSVLLQQKEDLTIAIDELLCDISNGDKYMKVYKQMKMYNDPELNPILKGKPL